MSSGRQPLTCIDLQRWTTTSVVSLLQHSGLNSNAHAISCSVDSNFQLNNTLYRSFTTKVQTILGSADADVFVLFFLKWQLFTMAGRSFCSPSEPCDRCRSWRLSGGCHSICLHSRQKGSPHWGLEICMFMGGSLRKTNIYYDEIQPLNMWKNKHWHQIDFTLVYSTH